MNGVFWPLDVRNRQWRRRAWGRLKWLIGIAPDVYVDAHGRLMIAGLSRWNVFTWKGVVIHDPCVYCLGTAESIEHVEPRACLRARQAASPGWQNLVGACERCNGGRGDMPLLRWLHWQHTRKRQPKKQKLKQFVQAQKAKLRDAKWTFVNEEAKQALDNGRTQKAS